MLAGIVLSCFATTPLVLPSIGPKQPPAATFQFMNQPDGGACAEQTASSQDPGGLPADSSGRLPQAILPLRPVQPKKVEPTGVDWRNLTRDSMLFVSIMHAFRWATEPGTRAGGVGLGSGYTRSVGNLHGWADGDPFYVNYVGHPMQGAVSGRLFLINDPRYNRAVFGKSSEYWKGKLRATAFAWAFSEQFEIGLLSEASIGHIQADFPQQGFVDHVITPTMGLAWMLGEDAVDEYIVRRIEDRTNNKFARILARTALNPARSFANLVDARAPWDRGSRAGIMEYKPANPRTTGSPTKLPVPPRLDIRPPKPAPFEFSIIAGFRQFSSGPCMGGGADAAYRVTPELQLALVVNGCKMLDLKTNLSGDALIYQIGPRWTPAPLGKWGPYAHVLVGGIKITHEQFYPEKKQEVLEANKNLDPSLAYTLHDQYTSHDEASGVALTVGTGVDYKLSDALAVRVASLEYLRSSVGRVGGMPYANGLQVTTGVVLRLGTW
jgi:hypothetical protein